MKQLKLFMFISLALFTFSFCYAQTSSELVGTKWVLEERMKKDVLEFTKDSLIPQHFDLTLFISS